MASSKRCAKCNKELNNGPCECENWILPQQIFEAVNPEIIEHQRLVVYREMKLASNLILELKTNWIYRGGLSEIITLLASAHDYVQLFNLELGFDEDARAAASTARLLVSHFETETVARDVSALESRFAEIRGRNLWRRFSLDELEELVALHLELSDYSGALMGTVASPDVSEDSRQVAKVKIQTFGQPREHFRSAFHNTVGVAASLIDSDQLDLARFKAAVETVHFFAEMYLIWCERRITTFEDRRAMFNLVKILRFLGNPVHVALAPLA